MLNELCNAAAAERLTAAHTAWEQRRAYVFFGWSHSLKNHDLFLFIQAVEFTLRLAVPATPSAAAAMSVSTSVLPDEKLAASHH